MTSGDGGDGVGGIPTHDAGASRHTCDRCGDVAETPLQQFTLVRVVAADPPPQPFRCSGDSAHVREQQWAVPPLGDAAGDVDLAVEPPIDDDGGDDAATRPRDGAATRALPVR